MRNAAEIQLWLELTLELLFAGPVNHEFMERGCVCSSRREL
jgi:hypothetical protein